MKFIDTPYTRIGLWFSWSWPWVRPVFRLRSALDMVQESPEDRERFEQCFEVASR